MINVEQYASTGADKLMHAALHLAGKPVVSEHSYNDPVLWSYDDPAVSLLLERYRLLVQVLHYVYMVNAL